MPEYEYDAVVVGSGPNGLAAAVTLAQRGLKVLVVEAKDSPGGGARTQELTLPGFHHDVCSAIHPLGLASPFFRSLDLERHGLRWIHPTVPAAQATDQEALLLHRSPAETAAQLGRDAGRYRALFEPLLAGWEGLDSDVLGPLRWPRHPLDFLRFGLRAPWPAYPLLKYGFSQPAARALLSGMVAHATIPFEWWFSFAPGFLLTLVGHHSGWPMPVGGSQSIIASLLGLLGELGGQVRCQEPVTALSQLPPARAVLLDLTPRQLLELPEFAHTRGWAQGLYRAQLSRYRYGPASFKIDYALQRPIPWKDPRLALAGTVHLGGSMEEVAAAERLVWQGQLHPRPYVLVAQQSLFDPSRAPAGRHTAWTYCHVPHDFQGDATAHIEAQLERFAPGFRDCVLAKHTLTPRDLQAHNPNYVGGDISGGPICATNLFTRPVLRLNPYTTPLPGVFLCSSSTPPGAGVHGMCGHHAALALLRVL